MEHYADKLAEAALLPTLYETQDTHWWSVGMRAITRALLDGIAFPLAPVLEIGCGGGAVLSELALHFPTRPVWGTDLNPVALHHARTTAADGVWQGDLHHLPIPKDTLGAVLALDSFDQTAVNVEIALREAYRTLQPNGIVLMRVSAFDWLRGPHDVAFGTGRRYSAGELREVFESVGFNTVRLTYANTLLFLPAALVRLGQRQGAGDVEDQLESPTALNVLFKAILHAEAAWLRHFNAPFGLSLYAIARKPSTPPL